jgi:glycosyltransferase involved in cell wall biosynthesis
MTKVSVIMPAYNAAPFIEKAVESVIAQTHTDWELIVIDDGSTDGTEQVLRAFTDTRIGYMRQANQGPAVARNLGLAESCGDYVIFLDADDWGMHGASNASQVGSVRRGPRMRWSMPIGPSSATRARQEPTSAVLWIETTH